MKNKNLVIDLKDISKKYSLGETANYQMLRDLLTEIPVKLASKRKGVKSKEFWALKGINLKISKGDVLGVVGKNGSGKSTLLKILAKIVTPTSGNGKIKGRVASMLEVGTGFHPELSGRENIYLSGAILGMKRKEIDEKFSEIVGFAEIDKFLDTPIKRYSSGMQVRLAFSVASNLDADVLLIDEVLSVGDAAFQRKSLRKMKTITQDQGKTVVFVSHSMPAVASLCNKVLFLENGKVKAFGKTEEIITKYLTNSDAEEVKSLKYLSGRGGNGKIRITRFYATDNDKKKVKAMKTGENYSFVFEYTCPDGKPQEDVDFSFAIRTMFEQNLFLHYMSYTNQVVKKTKRNGKFIFNFAKMPLAEGKYRLSFRGTVGGEEADHVDAAFTIDVVNGDYYGTGNIIAQQHSPIFINGDWSTE